VIKSSVDPGLSKSCEAENNGSISSLGAQTGAAQSQESGFRVRVAWTQLVGGIMDLAALSSTHASARV
jgi:hypothetical protein